MKESDEKEKEVVQETVLEKTVPADDPATTRAKRIRVERRLRGRDKTAIAAISAIVLIAAGLIFAWWWQSRQSGAGRPVPAPRMTGNTPQQGTSTTTTTTSESTVTLTPEVAARSGIKVETVGEQLAPEAAGGTPANGVVQANAYRSTPVVSLVGGIVRRVGAELGQSVGRGQTVAVVFSDELAEAQSRYLTALADLDEQRKRYRRTGQLVEIGAASREEMEQATTKLKTAEAEVASNRQRLLLLGLSQQRVGALRNSSQVSSEVSLPAPVAGTVISRAANPGEVVEANKEILRVADLSSVWVIAQVYEKDLASVRVGSGASITSQSYPGRVFRGRVTYVDPALDPTTRTAQVRVELANPGQALKIGMYVQVAFATIGGSEQTMPTVPVSAVQNLGNQQVVFVATTDPNVFVMRPVRLGPETNGRYPVLEGLTVGERIVTEGSFMLRAEWLKLNPGGTGQAPATDHQQH
ncbi:MAG TPA: efflux RND transporter periplasmic adaptor subunit [Pyrinomonadaceae bacterium]|nr:efflux RND transporter periplasmic adaptor subunit [Pyrinomonadaceae bacterium]